MNNKKQQIPAIRFKGFTDAWEERKFKDNIISIQTGTNLIGSSSNRGILLIKMGNIQRGYFSLDKVEKLKLEAEVAGKDMVREGDFLFNTRNTLELVGKGATWFGKSNMYAFNSNIARFTFSGIDTYFFNYLYNLPNMIKQVKARAVGTTSVAAVYPRDLNSLSYYLPQVQEQKKIGAIFKQLDDVTALYQRQMENYKQLKKSMLQKMFAQEGEKVPEVRFGGFTEEWEQRKLENIFGKILNAFVGTDTPYYVDNGHFYLESNNVKNVKINRNSEIFINDEFYEKQKDKWLHTNDLVMVQSGHVGHVAVIPEELDGTAAHALIMFQDYKVKSNPYFLNYQFQTSDSKKKLDTITTGNTIKHILASEMKIFEVTLPNFEEQTKIGTFFFQLDNTIALHQQKVNDYQALKNTILKKMFV